VGSGQKRLAISADGRYYVGPDNGLFAPALEGRRQIKIRELDCSNAAPTFHGRDVFAPAAALLAAGRSISRMGRPAGNIAELDLPLPRKTAKGFCCEVIHCDRFGNLVTNLRPEQLAGEQCEVKIGRRVLSGLARTYSDAREGEVLVLTGSHGFIEIAVRNGSAVDRLRTGRGGKLTVRNV
jgi:hypothetical protein